MQTFGKILAGIVITLPLLTSCSSTRVGVLNAARNHSECNQNISFNYSKKDMPTPFYDIKLDSNMTAHFSRSSLFIANSIGIMDILAHYVSLKTDDSTKLNIEKRIELLETTLKINQKINNASIEISSITSELDCEEERADQVGNYLKGKEDETETRLTVGTIIVGALGTLSTAIFLKDEKHQDVADFIGIAGGVTEAVLGTMILLNKRKIVFLHPRNILHEVWNKADTSTIFPAFVWNHLTYKNPYDSTSTSICEDLIKKWSDFGQISEYKKKKAKKQHDVYFGKGGLYTSEQLKNRSDMIDQLEAQISMMKQALRTLAIELENME